MRKLGVVLRAGKGKLIVKARFAPRLFEAVYDLATKPIGKVVDVFGPVASPYIVVSVSVSEYEQYVGQPVFTKPVKTYRRRRSYGRRRVRMGRR